MAAASSTFSLPAPGSFYFDFLQLFPIGVPMEVDLAECDDERCEFTVTKVKDDEWKGCPFELGTVSTAELFEQICAALEGEEVIRVWHGKDPRKVKKEFVQRSVCPAMRST